jgi:hypothetical protein
LDYSIKLQIPENFEGDIPIELQQILWKELWDKRKNIHGFCGAMARPLISQKTKIKTAYL